MVSAEQGKAAFTDVAGNANVNAQKAVSNANDRDARIAELERQLQSTKVENGRVKKYSEENEELRRKVEELESKLSAPESLKEDLPEGLRESIPDDVVQGTGVLIQKGNKRLKDELTQEIQKLKQENLAERQGRFCEAIESKYPGFLAS